MKHIYQIWKSSFNEDDDYIDFFTKEGLPLGHQLTSGPAEAPYASLFLFPVYYEHAGVSYPGFYLYALGILPNYQNSGHGKTLINKAKLFAMETGRHFILLQPANRGLYEYYRKLGFDEMIYRASFKISRSSIHNPTLFMEHLNLCRLLDFSVPLINTPTKEHVFNCFSWPPQLREYMNKECLFRGGRIIDHAYCYPAQDAEGPFIEIKEIYSSSVDLSMLIPSILDAFPQIDRFSFYGKLQQKAITGVREEPFAVVYFINPELKKCHHSQRSYFALGLD